MQELIAYLDCHSGISGDMFLGALLDLDAGFSLDFLKSALAGLPLHGFELRLEAFQDKGILGSRFDVVLTEQNTSFPQIRSLSDVEALLHASTLSIKVREIALSIFQCLAKAEATVHGISVEEVHFHEVGAIDAIIDITGAAILATQARFDTPAIYIERVGYGFGRKQFPWPNCLRICLGRAGNSYQQSELADIDWVAVIESNIDNMTGELLGGLMDKLFSAGALDVNYTPIQMKKNRPAVMLTIICRVEEGKTMSELLLSESSTLGVRISQVQRIKAQRVLECIETPFGPISMKVKRLGNRIISATPEYEDCQRIALEKGIPLENVYEVARQVMKTILPA